MWRWPFGQSSSVEGDVCWDLFSVPGCKVVVQSSYYSTASVVVNGWWSSPSTFIVHRARCGPGWIWRAYLTMGTWRRLATSSTSPWLTGGIQTSTHHAVNCNWEGMLNSQWSMSHPTTGPCLPAWWRATGRTITRDTRCTISSKNSLNRCICKSGRSGRECDASCQGRQTLQELFCMETEVGGEKM